MEPGPSLGQVAVLGGGLAGLLTAHVLTRYATGVTVVERDRYPVGPEPRPGVPQSRHTHVLLASGIQAVRELLPGFVAELTDAGAPALSVPADVGVWQAGQWVSRRNPSAPVMTPSRPLLDHLVRKRVLAEPRIRLMSATEATGLLGGPDRVTGVTIRARGARVDDELAADLVIDATGRSSHTSAWLARLGAAEPAEEVLDAGRGYATGVCQLDGRIGDLGGFYIVPDAGQPLGAIILPAEDNRWLVTLSGPRGQAPPTDPAGFVDFARNLPHDAPHKWLSTARLIGRPVGYRRTANRRRRYDRAAPAGLLVVGDAVCALNPVYGQGMSVAAMNAVFLDHALSGAKRTPSAHELQQAVRRSSQWAWEVATSADSPMPGAVGNALRTGPLDRLVDRYVARVRERVPGDPVVCRAFRDVLFLLAPPRSLLTAPQVVLRSLLRAPTPTPPDLPTP